MSNRPRSAAALSLCALALMLFLTATSGFSAEEAATEKRQEGPSQAMLAYPEARKVSHVDTYHGTEVEDPYRWMEAIDSEEVKQWITAQNALTSGWIGAVSERNAIRDKLLASWNYERVRQPSKVGKRYLYSYNDGTMEKDVLLLSDHPATGGSVLIDPNEFPKEEAVSLRGWSVSSSNRYLAYGLTRKGSDWTEWRVKDLEKQEDLPDLVQWTKASSVAWSPNDTGFYYMRYPEPSASEAYTGLNVQPALYWHWLNKPQSEDVFVADRKEHPSQRFGVYFSDDQQYLFMWLYDTARQGMGFAYKKLGSDEEFTELHNAFDADYRLLGNDGSIFYFLTTLNAPRGRIVAIDVENPARSLWKEIVAQDSVTLEDADMVGDTIVAQYVRDCCSEFRLFGTDGSAKGLVPLPGRGSVGGASFDGKRTETERFYTYQDAVTPPSVYRWDATTGKSELLRQPKVPMDLSRYEATQVFFNNRDGLKVPLFISHRKGLKLDGSNPTILYGYGGFNADTRSTFSTSTLAWLELGGVMVRASLRGDGDYGDAWHMAATRINKQRTFDDFIDAAEYLIETGYTTPAKLAIWGGSNGGLLVGACLNQRPDLFGAAIPQVGVMDMLRFHNFTLGAGWVREYGSSADPLEFQALLAYSPYHNIRSDVAYPPVLVTTGDHDDRVVPSHSYKYAARLQELQGKRGAASSNPMLIRIETSGGHGGGTTLSEAAESIADSYAFLIRALKVKVPEEALKHAESSK